MIEEVVPRSKYTLSIAARREATTKNRHLHRNLDGQLKKIQTQRTLSEQLLIKKIYLIKIDSLHLKHEATRLNSREHICIRPMSAHSNFGRSVSRPVAFSRSGRRTSQGSQLRLWAGLDCVEGSPISTQRIKAKQKQERPMSAYSVKTRASNSSTATRRPTSAQVDSLTYQKLMTSHGDVQRSGYGIYQGGMQRQRPGTAGYDVTKRRFTII